MHEDFDFDGEAEMKTLQEVHGMLLMTGYKAEAEAVKKAMQDQIDAECFRWWDHEAAENPVGVAKSIAHCITEDDYRLVIVGAKMAKDAAIKQAMEQ